MQGVLYQNDSLTLTEESGFYRYIRQVNKIPSLSQEEESFLAKSYLEKQDLAAAGKLVTSHLKLVVRIAFNYKNYGLPVDELISEGTLGLMQAVKKFDPYLGFRLSTYAMWWIKASIQEYILRSWSLVKIGTTTAQKKLFFSLNKIKHKLANLYSRNVTEQDFPQIAEELGVTCNEVKEMSSRLVGSDMSLNSVVNRDGERDEEWIELLPESRPNQEVLLSAVQETSQKKKALMQALKVLKDRELQILSARKLQDIPSTLEELSIEHNISKERVRQIENKAFEKIQNFILEQYSTKIAA
jgi:RNA polymerase sigma-32 factor